MSLTWIGPVPPMGGSAIIVEPGVTLDVRYALPTDAAPQPTDVVGALAFRGPGSVTVAPPSADYLVYVRYLDAEDLQTLTKAAIQSSPTASAAFLTWLGTLPTSAPAQPGQPWMNQGVFQIS